MTHSVTDLLLQSEDAYYFNFFWKELKKKCFSKNVLPSSKQETADGIYGFRRSVSVKLIAYLLIFLSWQLSPPPKCDHFMQKPAAN